MGCNSSVPATPTDIPDSVAFFFNGEPMAGKAEKYMGDYVADNHTLAFVGPHALPLPVLDKAAFGGAAGKLIGSFPDLTFNIDKATPKRNKDGSWSADIVVMGTHTGAAFTPMPGKLPPIETTGKCVKIGPETFTLWTDAEGKVCKTEITPLGAGHPHGPPGFYLEIGGSLAALSPPPPADCCMMAEVKDFEDWHAGFKAHATETTFKIGGKEYTVPMARGEACDEAKTLVFCDESNANKVAIAMYALDFAKFGPVMASESFQEMSKEAIVSQDPPLLMTPPGPDAGPKPNMFFWVEVKDVDKWIAGFKAHGVGKTSELWEGEVPISRGEFVDEAKTRVFKCVTNPNIVGAYMEGVQMDKLGPLLNDPKMAELTTTLGEVDGTKVMNVVAAMPA